MLKQFNMSCILFCFFMIGTCMGNVPQKFDSNGKPNRPAEVTLPMHLHEYSIYIPFDLKTDLELVTLTLNFHIRSLSWFYVQAFTEAHSYPKFFIENVTLSDKTTIEDKVVDLIQKAEEVDEAIVTITKHYIAYTLHTYYLYLEHFKRHAFGIVYKSERNIRKCKVAGDCGALDPFTFDVVKVDKLTKQMLSNMKKADFEALLEVVASCQAMIFNEKLYKGTEKVFQKKLKEAGEARQHTYELLKSLAEFSQLE